LKAGAAFAGVSAIGFPSIVSGQSEKIKIGHLTPLTGFLGALGGYAQLGIRMAEAEINAAAALWAASSTSPRKTRSIPPPAATKAQRMLEQDQVAFLMGRDQLSLGADHHAGGGTETRNSSCRSAPAPTRCAARTATDTLSMSTSRAR